MAWIPEFEECVIVPCWGSPVGWLGSGCEILIDRLPLFGLTVVRLNVDNKRLST